MSIDHARAVRASRVAALRDLATGRTRLADVLREPPEALLCVDLYDVLMRAQGVNRERTRIACERSGIWPHLKMSELTKAQRLTLIRNLPGG